MRLSRHLTALTLAVPFVLLPAAPAAAACTITVDLPNYAPDSATVPPGTTVTWCWASDNHSVTGTGGGFDSHPACPPTCGTTGYQVSRQISATFAYHCRIHSGMQGQILVSQPSPSATTSSPTPSRTTAPPSRTPSPTPTVRPTTPSPTPTRTPTPTPSPTTATPLPPTLPPTTAPVTTSPAPLDPPPAKPNTGVAIGIGLLVAAAALGGATVLWLRGRGA